MIVRACSATQPEARPRRKEIDRAQELRHRPLGVGRRAGEDPPVRVERAARAAPRQGSPRSVVRPFLEHRLPGTLLIPGRGIDRLAVGLEVDQDRPLRPGDGPLGEHQRHTAGLELGGLEAARAEGLAEPADDLRHIAREKGVIGVAEELSVELDRLDRAGLGPSLKAITVRASGRRRGTGNGDRSDQKRRHERAEGRGSSGERHGSIVPPRKRRHRRSDDLDGDEGVASARPIGYPEGISAGRGGRSELARWRECRSLNNAAPCSWRPV